MKNSYFKELTLNLQHEGFTVGPEENGLLPVELDGRRLCCAVENGEIRYRAEGQGRKCCVKEGNPTVKKRWISRVRGKPE